MSMAKTAGQKSKLYAKYGKQIYVAAKNGGADPVANPSLKLLIDKGQEGASARSCHRQSNRESRFQRWGGLLAS